MKKTLSILLAVLMLLTSFSAITANALTLRAIALCKKVDNLSDTVKESVDVIDSEHPCFDITDLSKQLVYYVDTEYNTYPFINGVCWYDETEGVYLNESSVFVTKHNYILKVRVTCTDKFEFNGTNVTCELYSGGQITSCTVEEVNPGKTINAVKEYTCDGVSTVDSVYVLLATPLAGSNPSSSAGVTDTSLGVEIDTDENEDYIDNKVKWTLVTDEGETVMKKDDCFVKDMKYRAYIRLKTKTGYEFKTESETKSAVVAKIGGNDTEVAATSSDKKLSEYITVCHAEPIVCTGDIKLDITKCTVNELKTDYTYDATEQSAQVEVKYSALTLKEGTDYEIVYSGNRTNAGTVNYSINGIRNYDGIIEKSFNIKALAVTPGVTLSATKYTYDGNEKKPTVTVKANGKKLVNKTDYTVTYKTGRKNVGKYYATVTLKGNYSGKKTAYYVINPKGTTLLTKKTCKKDSITVNWNKQTAQTGGYEIEYSTSSKFSSSKKIKISKNTTVSKKITGLKKSKTYYFRIRTFKNVTSNGKTETYYSSWSASKNFKTTAK